jgi:CxxC motif-containing protein (DUF1111 family)
MSSSRTASSNDSEACCGATAQNIIPTTAKLWNTFKDCYKNTDNNTYCMQPPETGIPVEGCVDMPCAVVDCVVTRAIPLAVTVTATPFTLFADGIINIAAPKCQSMDEASEPLSRSAF